MNIVSSHPPHMRLCVTSLRVATRQSNYSYKPNAQIFDDVTAMTQPDPRD